MVSQGSGSFSPSSLPNEFVFLPLLQPPTLVTTIPLLHSWVTDSFLKWKCIGCALTDRYASHPRNHVSHCLMSMCPEVGTQNTHSAPPLLLVSHSGLSLYRGKKIHSIYVRCSQAYGARFQSHCIVSQKSRGNLIHTGSTNMVIWRQHL